MTLGFLNKIHEERRLSMSHWRFRLLHWCFNEGSPKTKYQSGLPNFLYEHYCPLFHLTNFIALFLPLIFLFRVTVSVATGLFKVLILPVIDKIDNYLNEKAEIGREKRRAEYETKEYQLSTFREEIIRRLTEGLIYDFDYIFTRYGHDDLTEEEAREVYDAVMRSVEEANKRKAEIKKRRYDRMVFWSNVGKTVVGWLMYAFYAVLFVASVYLAIELFQPIVNLIKFIFSADYSWVLPVLFVIFKLVVLTSVIAAALYVLIRAESMKPVRTGLNTCVLPLGVLCRAFVSFVKLPVTCYRTVREFISVFYSENCPPIVMISDDEAQVEETVCNS